jgi:DNA-binding GntR family transcriptional regulator
MPDIQSFSAPSRADWVFENLREEIVSLDIEPGAAIVESDIARRFGVSTTPVREALQRLAKDGLVVLSRYRGATVLKLEERDVREIYQLREAVEPLAVRLAVPQLTEAEISSMASLLGDAEEALTLGNWDKLSQCNRQFHGIFITRSGNKRLQQVLENLQEQNRVIALLTWRTHGHDVREQEEHLAILEAVRARDGELAAERLREHIVRFGAWALKDWHGDQSRSSISEEVQR